MLCVQECIRGGGGDGDGGGVGDDGDGDGGDDGDGGGIVSRLSNSYIMFNQYKFDIIENICPEPSLYNIVST